MATCPGKKGVSKAGCGSSVHRCKKCGSVGCDQSSKGYCTNQGFYSGRCVKCGALGQKEAVK